MVSTDPGRIVSSQPEPLSGGLNRLSSVEKSGSESGRFQPGSSSDEYPDLSGLFLDNFDRYDAKECLPLLESPVVPVICHLTGTASLCTSPD